MSKLRKFILDNQCKKKIKNLLRAIKQYIKPNIWNTDKLVYIINICSFYIFNIKYICYTTFKCLYYFNICLEYIYPNIILYAYTLIQDDN